MLEISIIKNGKTKWEYSSCKRSKKNYLLSISTLLAPINSKLLDDPFKTFKSPEAQTEMIEKIKTLSEFEKWDLSQAGKYKEWLEGSDLTNFKEITPLKGEGVNAEYFKEVENLIPQQVKDEKLNMLERMVNGLESKIEPISRVSDTLNKIVEDITWIIHNPLHSILIVLEWLAPIVVTGSVIIIIIGLIAKLLGSEKLFNMNTKDMIINPIIFLIIYLILITALRCVVG